MMPSIGDDSIRKVYTREGHIFYKICSSGSAEIIDILIYEQQRRKGHGKTLVDNLINELSYQGIISIYLFTRESNTDAQSFYSNIGFKKVCNIKGMYSGEGIDRNSVLFIKEING